MRNTTTVLINALGNYFNKKNNWGDIRPKLFRCTQLDALKLITRSGVCINLIMASVEKGQ